MSNKETGVSPVIGVLLMLTLTLIIAAVVNMYAGGLVKTDPKPPSVTLQVSYSTNDPSGMVIRHMSGDPIPLSSSQFMIRPDETMGPKYQQYPCTLNQSYFTNQTGTLLTTLTAIKVGDVINITSVNISKVQNENKVPDLYKLSSSNNGKTFDLELYYKNSLISRNQVLIEP